MANVKRESIKIKITYQGPLDIELDEKIQNLMESIGAKWYAQGTDLITGIRDICFDIDKNHINKESGGLYEAKKRAVIDCY